MGIDDQGRLREDTKAGPQAFQNGRTAPLYTATVRGSVVYGISVDGELLRFTGAGLASQIGDGPWTFDASGRTLTLSAAGTSGQLVINLKTRQAWRINVPQGTVPSWTGVSCARAVWDVRDHGGEARGKGVYIMNVDTGKAQLLKTKTGSLNTPVVNGKAIAWTYDRSDGLVQFKSIVLK